MKGEGNHYDYGMRHYDPRIGRFFTYDPIASQFPFWSPYHFAGNSPIENIDMDGLETYNYRLVFDNEGKSKLQLINIEHGSLCDLGTFQKVHFKGGTYTIDGELNYAPYHGFKNVNKLNGLSREQVDKFFKELKTDAVKAEEAKLEDQARRDEMLNAYIGMKYAKNVAKNSKSKVKQQEKAAPVEESAPEISVVKVDKSRINLAKGRTRFTPKRGSTGQPVSAGWDHVVDGHFNKSLSGTRSIFTVSQEKLKSILQSKNTINSPVTALDGGQFKRTVNTGEVVGNANLKQGGGETSWIDVITDKKGNLITTYPVAAPTTK